MSYLRKMINDIIIFNFIKRCTISFFFLILFSYQNGPDTYLLQLRDTDFPVRLREYMKVACNRSPGFSRTITEENFDWRVNSKRFKFESVFFFFFFNIYTYNI